MTLQFYLFQAQVETALGGPVGLYATEQRLRYLIGMTATDGRLIRPATPPLDLKVVFDWENALGQALDRRVEIRRQRFQVRRREMELIAARLNLRPRLDFLAQYRWRGLGNHLLGDTTAPPVNPNTGQADLGSNLYGTILGGDYQEARAGIELNFPVGLRAASTAVANARLNLRRENALLAETELQVSHVLSEAARQVELRHQLLETNYNRFAADMVQADVLEKRKNAFPGGLFIALQAQRQVVNSASEFYRSLSEYNLAIRDFHREKGSLLAYDQVLLAEGPWAAGSAGDAYRVGRFLTPRIHPEKVCAPRPISSGIFNPSEVQNTTPVEPSESVPSSVELLPSLSEAAAGEFRWPSSQTLIGANAEPSTGAPAVPSSAIGIPSYASPNSGPTRLDDTQPVNVAPVPANYTAEE